MYGKVQAMLNNPKLTVALCKKLWAKAVNNATILENRLKPSDCDADAFSRGSSKCGPTCPFAQIWQNLHHHQP